MTTHPIDVHDLEGHKTIFGIHPERARLADETYTKSNRNVRETMALVLGYDDGLRISRPDLFAAASNPDEAELPDGVTMKGPDDDSFHAYEKEIGTGRYALIHRAWTADDLEQIAKHMRWRSRQAAKPAAPALSAYEAAYNYLRNDDAMDQVEAQVIAGAIRAALAAAHSAKGQA